MNRPLAITTALTALCLATGCDIVVAAAVVAALDADWGSGADWSVDSDWDSYSYRNNTTSVVCLGVNGALPAAPDLEELVVRGNYVGLEYTNALRNDNLLPCWQDPSYAVQVRDHDGRVWTVGFDWLDSDGFDLTPEPTIEPGEPVELLFRADTTPGSQAAGFVLSRGEEVAYAFESGRGGQALRDGDLPGVEVRSGDVLDVSGHDCGERELRLLEFVADSSTLTLYPSEDGVLEVDGEDYTVCSITDWRAVDNGCDDGPALESSYVVFR